MFVFETNRAFTNLSSEQKTTVLKQAEAALPDIQKLQFKSFEMLDLEPDLQFTKSQIVPLLFQNIVDYVIPIMQHDKNIVLSTNKCFFYFKHNILHRAHTNENIFVTSMLIPMPLANQHEFYFKKPQQTSLSELGVTSEHFRCSKFNIRVQFDSNVSLNIQKLQQIQKLIKAHVQTYPTTLKPFVAEKLKFVLPMSPLQPSVALDHDTELLEKLLLEKALVAYAYQKGAMEITAQRMFSKSFDKLTEKEKKMVVWRQPSSLAEKYPQIHQLVSTIYKKIRLQDSSVKQELTQLQKGLNLDSSWFSLDVAKKTMPIFIDNMFVICPHVLLQAITTDPETVNNAFTKIVNEIYRYCTVCGQSVQTHIKSVISFSDVTAFNPKTNEMQVKIFFGLENMLQSFFIVKEFFNKHLLLQFAQNTIKHRLEKLFSNMSSFEENEMQKKRLLVDAHVAAVLIVYTFDTKGAFIELSNVKTNWDSVTSKQIYRYIWHLSKQLYARYTRFMQPEIASIIESVYKHIKINKVPKIQTRRLELNFLTNLSFYVYTSKILKLLGIASTNLIEQIFGKFPIVTVVPKHTGPFLKIPTQHKQLQTELCHYHRWKNLQYLEPTVLPEICNKLKDFRKQAVAKISIAKPHHVQQYVIKPHEIFCLKDFVHTFGFGSTCKSCGFKIGDKATVDINKLNFIKNKIFMLNFSKFGCLVKNKNNNVVLQIHNMVDNICVVCGYSGSETKDFVNRTMPLYNQYIAQNLSKPVTQSKHSVSESVTTLNMRIPQDILYLASNICEVPIAFFVNLGLYFKVPWHENAFKSVNVLQANDEEKKIQATQLYTHIYRMHSFYNYIRFFSNQPQSFFLKQLANQHASIDKICKRLEIDLQTPKGTYFFTGKNVNEYLFYNMAHITDNFVSELQKLFAFLICAPVLWTSFTKHRNLQKSAKKLVNEFIRITQDIEIDNFKAMPFVYEYIYDSSEDEFDETDYYALEKQLINESSEIDTTDKFDKHIVDPNNIELLENMESDLGDDQTGDIQDYDNYQIDNDYDAKVDQ